MFFFFASDPRGVSPSTFKLINSAAICWPQGRHHCGRKPNYIKGLQFKLLVSGIEWVSHASWHFRSSLLKVTVWKYTNDTQERSHLPAPIVTSHLKQVVIWRIMKGSSQRRSHLPAPNVTRHLGIVVNWRYTRGFTRERSHVTRHLQKVAVWRYTKGHTQERSHLPAAIVSRHLKQVVIWRIMKGSSQQRSHLSAPNVTRHSGIVVNWRYTRGFTREKSHVTRHLHKVVVWRYTKGHTQERSHLPAGTVENLFAFSKCDKAFRNNGKLMIH